jgi:hypothetical protein
VRPGSIFDAPGDFGNARPFFFARLMASAGKAGFELVTRARHFGQAAFMNEWRPATDDGIEPRMCRPAHGLK